MSQVHVLIATVPWRKASCEHLLECLTKQTRVPDQVELVLDGYGDTPAPKAPASLSIREWRTAKPSGPGNRWRICEDLPPDTVVVSLDDDLNPIDVPRAVELLSTPAVERDEVGTSSGRRENGAYFSWSSTYPPVGQRLGIDGSLISFHAGMVAVRAKHVKGLRAFVTSLPIDFDMLGIGGDDEAPLSAHLWKQNVRIQHVQGLAKIRHYPGTQGTGSEFTVRNAYEAQRGLKVGWQRVAVAKATGWPWPKVLW